MVARARLTPPRQAQTDWPWHHVKSSSLKASLFFSGGRRMEAENLLADGFLTRAAIESKSSGWKRFINVAQTRLPSRLKGIIVKPEFGTPFLAATQVYNMRPMPRKWLSLSRTSDADERFVSEGTILVSRSGSVGRAILAHSTTKNVLVSDDLLRVSAREHSLLGWIYAYLRAPSVRGMMNASQYGHMIKHLEVSHLDELPIVIPNDSKLLKDCNNGVRQILRSRNKAIQKINEADKIFEEFFSSENFAFDEATFTRKASQSLFSSRRRFDAWSHNPEKEAIESELKKRCSRWMTLREAGCDIWLPNRFKRIPAEDGVELVNSSQIFEINPDYEKRISAADVIDRNNGFVEAGWLLMSRSGQVYGLLGSVAMTTGEYISKVISDHVIRISAGDAILPGYLYMVLGHSLLGRPRVKALAYGSSIPCIEVEDLKEFPIPRLGADAEKKIAALSESAFALWAKADEIEGQLAELADSEVKKFLGLG